MVETNPPRNSQLQLIEADERRGQARTPAPGVFSAPHRIDSLSCAVPHTRDDENVLERGGMLRSGRVCGRGREILASRTRSIV